MTVASFDKGEINNHLTENGNEQICRITQNIYRDTVFFFIYIRYRRVLFSLFLTQQRRGIDLESINTGTYITLCILFFALVRRVTTRRCHSPGENEHQLSNS